MNDSIFPSIHPTTPPSHPGVYADLAELVRLKFRTRGFSFLPRQPMHSILAGRHASRLRGVNFEELRRYLPGDDIRHMDWRVTARTRKPHVRVYSEERDRPVLLVIDQRQNMFFGRRRAMKSVVAAEVSALAAWRVLQAGDRVGALVFDDAEVVEIPPQRSEQQVLRILGRVVQENHALRMDPNRRANPAMLNRALEQTTRLALHDYLVCAIGDAISLALTVFAHDQGIRDRVLIVLIDGNDTGSQVPPIRAAEIARDQKITIHTVAVGDPTAAGEEKLDEETLKTVAATTGGQYAHANDQAALADIYAQLDGLRTREVPTVSHRPRHELFHWPLGVGVLLSLVYHLAWAVRMGLRRKFGIPATAAAPVGMVAALPMATGLSQFHFLRPWWLLAVIPALWLVWMICRHQDAARPWRGVIVDHLLPYLLAERGPRRRLQPVHLLLLIWFLAILSLSGPTWQREPAPFADDEAALVIALEVTPTMLAQDVHPSRLERAEQKIRDLLAERPRIRTALGGYAGSAHLVMPLTRDADLITRFAAELSPTIMPVAGDVASEALAVSQEQPRKSGLRDSILLITDGVSAEQLPQLAAYHKNGGAPVQILAVAASAGVPVPPNSPPAPALDREALDKAAEVQDATLTIVCADDSDVRWLARHTATRLVVTSAEQTGERWKDAGYRLVFGVAALALMWFRPGWLVQWS